MSNICVFIDGTWNDQADENTTNVYRMRARLARGQTGLYFRGLGNEFDHEGALGAVGRALGGMFGAGAADKRDQAYSALEAAYRKGDRIAVFGFSRGAAIARQLCVKVSEEGLQGHKPDIKFLGCFDTVASYGIPGNDINLFSNFRVAGCVERAVHLIAAGETRQMFPVTLMERRASIDEIWLPGGHSDIGGGGSQARGLANIAQMIMEHEATERGFRFEPGLFLPADPEQEAYIAPGYKLHAPRVPGYLRDGRFVAEPALIAEGMSQARNAAELLRQ